MNAQRTQTKESGLLAVKQVLAKMNASEEVKSKVIAVFVSSTSVWWYVDADYLEYLVRQLVTLFSHKFEDERMTIPANMVYLMATERGAPSILLHWRVYLSLYKPFVSGWRLETIKNGEGRPIGMTAIILDKDGNEWRWERYYDNLALTERWKNKELMFAKTILKEALAIMFPELNLMPPLAIVETYDPDDIVYDVSQTGVNVSRANTSVSMLSESDHKPKQQKHENGESRATEMVKRLTETPPPAESDHKSKEMVKRLTETPPPAELKDKSLDAEYIRQMNDVFKEAALLVGKDEATKVAKQIVNNHGAQKYSDLSSLDKLNVLVLFRDYLEQQKRKQNESQ